MRKLLGSTMFYILIGGAYLGDSTQLTYLRSRYYSSGTGRFITADPSKMETNLHLYAKANPINRVDPTGLFSQEVIAKNMNIDRFFAGNDSWKDHSKWGFYALLRQAQNGDVINTGYESLAFRKTQSQYWSTPRTIYLFNCEKILVGPNLQPLDEYYTTVVEKNWDKNFWWRDTTSEHYYLHRNGSFPVIYWDGFDEYGSTYPEFLGVSVGVGVYEFGYLVDFHGNKYASVGFGPSATVGISYLEGYLCDWSLTSYSCSGSYPSASDIEAAVAGICAGPEFVFFSGMDLGALCKDWEHWNPSELLLTSSVATFYSGAQFGGGVGFTATFPLSWFGVPADSRDGWKDLLDTRLNYGWTWDKIQAKGLYVQ